MAERPYHHGTLRAELLRLGLEAARAGGPAAVSLRDLAGRAGVSPAAVYRHYPDLDHLMAEIAQQARHELAERMRRAARETPAPRRMADRPWHELRAIGREYVRWAVAEPHLFDTAFAPNPVSPTTPDDPSAWDVLVGAIDRLRDEGVITARRHREAPVIAWSAVHGLASILVRTQAPEPSIDTTTIDWVVDGVRRALAS